MPVHLKDDFLLSLKISTPALKKMLTMVDLVLRNNISPAISVPQLHEEVPDDPNACHPAKFLKLDLQRDSEDYLRLSRNSVNAFARFKEEWEMGHAVVFEGGTDLIKADWSPTFFTEHYGGESANVVDCETKENITMTVKDFFKFFLDPELSRKQILKLPDWPPHSDFRAKFPDHYNDFLCNTPFLDYSGFTGCRNLAARLPVSYLPPDLGPKMYNAFGSSDAGDYGQGTTPIHLDMADAVNVMMYCSSSPADRPAAVWDIYALKDLPKLREYLNEYVERTGCAPNMEDCIHDQMFYLNQMMREELWKKKGVRAWRIFQNPGDAIFVPAGCAHQDSLTAIVSILTKFVQMTTTIFTNAAIVGGGDRRYTVVVHDGVVQAVRTVSDVETGVSISDDDDVVDLRGAFVLAPSLVDHHVHSAAWTLHMRRLNLFAAVSAAEVLSLVADRILKVPKSSEVLVGCGFRVGSWPDLDDLNRDSLDQVSNGHPVALICSDLHSMVCNSAALSILGSAFESESESGWLREKPCFDATVKLGDVGDELLDSWVEEMALDAARKGVTEIVDFEMNDNLSSWTRRISVKGFRTLRVRAGMYQPHIHNAISRKLKSGDVVPDTHGLLTVGPYKIITDGSLGTQTAYCHSFYPNTRSNGLWIYEDETLRTMAEYGTANSLTLAIHAIGDKANQKTLEILSSLSTGPPLLGSSIEHAQLVSEEDTAVFAQLGLIASIQPEHLNDDRELCMRFWPSCNHRAFPYRSLLEAGASLKLGSDAPVAPLDPWRAIAAAVSRSRGAVDIGGEFEDGFHPEQKIERIDAWVASTSNGKVNPEKGDRADLCILNADPLECDIEQLRNMEVFGTMLGGKWTFKNI
ncbi:hypothetical protein HDU82_007617 [Entophlyctis luteolus]|nr:hypothetical protein HDU82_007617 [Entophlyctis luteolus]